MDADAFEDGCGDALGEHGGCWPSGQLGAAQLLLDQGAELDWIPGWENLTPLDAAVRSGAAEVTAWLRERGAKTAAELGRQSG